MTDDEDIDHPIDEDYIDVRRRRADVSDDEEEAVDDTFERGSRAHQNADTHRRLDISAGSGAAPNIDELIDKNAIIEHDGRAETRTFYYPSEAPDAKQKQMARMLRWQEGEGDSPQKNINEADRNRWIDTFTGYVGMTGYQQEQVRKLVQDIDMDKMSNMSSEEIILSAISLVGNKSDRWIRDEDDFKQLVEDVETSGERIRTCRKMIRRHSEHI